VVVFFLLPQSGLTDDLLRSGWGSS